MTHGILIKNGPVAHRVRQVLDRLHLQDTTGPFSGEKKVLKTQARKDPIGPGTWS